jgi:hypothetical protein
VLLLVLSTSSVHWRASHVQVSLVVATRGLSAMVELAFGLPVYGITSLRRIPEYIPLLPGEKYRFKEKQGLKIIMGHK